MDGRTNKRKVGQKKNGTIENYIPLRHSSYAGGINTVAHTNVKQMPCLDDVCVRLAKMLPNLVSVSI